MVNVTITTTLPVEVYREIKSKHLSFNGLIMTGLRAEDKMVNLTERLRDVEGVYQGHVTTIRELRSRLARLEEEKGEEENDDI